MEGWQLCFIPYLYFYAFGKYYNHEWKLMANFEEMEGKIFDWNLIGQNADQRENVNEFCQRQSETVSLVNIGEVSENKD